ncbi:hypothetical protein [Methylobacterium sp. R2-1]|uniref:hypothetical protein n=1 Tax=Methylobacterium sp. R2-1 TaxID=2587064 RepID=UPI001622664D|nr:hypothetical protein [Methylobacterium sp. R2-1]MBB2963721.1 acyl-CoA reductase-like NAD-dependent aldehyde dehydrogenase [Methylobacterium sp. R2-1]
MRRPIAVSALLLTGLMAAVPALGQDAGDTRLSPTGRTVTTTGQTKPPAPGAPQGQVSPASQDQMLKAQRAAQARDKAWDAKMNKTMGSICKGC